MKRKDFSNPQSAKRSRIEPAMGSALPLTEIKSLMDDER